MTGKERAEHAKLLDLWATRKATSAQIARCMALDRKAAADSPTAPEAAALADIVFAYEFRSELTASDADCAGHLYDIARKALESFRARDLIQQPNRSDR